MRVKWKEGVGRKVMYEKHEEKQKQKLNTHTLTQTYVYTRAFTNLCTDIKIKNKNCGGNKLAHVLLKC